VKSVKFEQEQVGGQTDVYAAVPKLDNLTTIVADISHGASELQRRLDDRVRVRTPSSDTGKRLVQRDCCACRGRWNVPCALGTDARRQRFARNVVGD
jgi:hypothetical protein